MIGGAGNDYISVSGVSAYTIDGGTGFDTLVLNRSDLTESVTVSMVSDSNGSSYEFGFPDGTTVTGIEWLSLTTGSGDDLATFANITSEGAQSWNAGNGNDTAVVDFSAFSSNIDTYYADYYSNYRISTGWNGNPYDYLIYLSGVENLTLYGGSGNDSFNRSSGNNTLIGNDGDDYFSVSGIGATVIDGGTGVDALTLNLSDLTEPVTVSMVSDDNGSSYEFGSLDGTTVTGIESFNLTTGIGDDLATFAITTMGRQSWNAGNGNDTAVLDFSAFSNNVNSYDGYSTNYRYEVGTQYDHTYASLDGVENLTLYGGSGNDSFSRTSGNNVLKGNDGDDVLNSGGGNDLLEGGSGNDSLADVNGGNDTLLGGIGNDSFNASGVGADSIDGGEGVDTLSLYRPDLTESVTVSVVPDDNGSTYEFGLSDGTTVEGIELLSLTTGSGDDYVTFANTKNLVRQIWSAGVGNDTAVVDLSAFSKSVYTYEGFGTGYRYEIGTQINETYLSFSNVENLTLYGGSGNDTFTRTSGNNTLIGNGGNDNLSGGTNNDTLTGNSGIQGGEGTDQAIYTNNRANYTLTKIETGYLITDNLGNEGTDTLTSIEQLIFADQTIIRGINTPPTLTPPIAALYIDTPNNDTFTTNTGTLTGNDADGDPLSYGIVGGKLNNGMVSKTGSYGTLRVNTSTGAYTFTPKDAAIEALSGNASQSYMLTVSDGKTSAKANWMVTLSGANDAPTASNRTLTSTEDTATVLAVTDFGFTDADAGDTLQSVTLTSLPTVGSLTLNGVAVTANQVIDVADINAGLFSYRPASNDTGYTHFAFKPSDGNAASGLAYTLTVNIKAVRDDLVINGTTGQDTLNGDLIDKGSFDRLYGLAGNDVLNGLAGNDTLSGGLGADTLTGGNGDDKYRVDNTADRVVEYLAKGLDLIESSVSYTLPNQVENLTLTGNSKLNAKGNTLANQLVGNSGDNKLDGNKGNDSLFGKAGNDTLVGGMGNDKLTGGTGKDVFLFNSAINAITNKDTLLDFNAVDDTIQLKKSVFTALGNANTNLAETALYSGAGITAAHDADDRILYNTSNGTLYYDADGNGSGLATQIATIGNQAIMSNMDFWLV